MLFHFYISPWTSLTVDASDTVIGDILEPRINGWSQLFASFSRQLRPPENKYNAFDREMLAIYLDVCHFCNFLEDRTFTMFIDQNPLTFTMSKISEPWSIRQQLKLSAVF